MNPSTYDFVHLALKALGGKVDGKTKLQKLVYFLGVLTGREQQLDYRPHYYGPYSAEVADAMDLLSAREFVQLSHATMGGTDDRGFELVRTDYSLSPDGEKIAEAKSKSNPALFREIKHAAEVLDKLKDRDYVKLSIAAKTYFMLKEDPTADLPSLAKQFGWLVTEKQINEAKLLLDSVGLVPTSK